MPTSAAKKALIGDLFTPVWSTRPSWASAPVVLTQWAESVLGSPVAAFADRTGGFSGGFASVLIGADGRRIFVKAVNADINPRAVELHRSEIRAAAWLQGCPSVPELLGNFDDGHWVALAFAAVDGITPTWPWREVDIAAAVTGLDQLHDLLTDRPMPDSPLAARRRLGPPGQRYAGQRRAVPLVADALRDDVLAWSRLLGRNDEVAALDPWLAARIPALSQLAQRADLTGTTLLNLDVRSDNIVLDSAGRAWFVDWSWAALGDPLLDVVVLMIDLAVSGHDPQAWLDRSRVAGAGAERIAAALAIFTGHWVLSCLQPDPPGVPGMRAFQSAHLAAAGAWLRRCLAQL